MQAMNSEVNDAVSGDVACGSRAKRATAFFKGSPYAQLPLTSCIANGARQHARTLLDYRYFGVWGYFGDIYYFQCKI